MKSFREFIVESDELNEKMMIFGKSAYPKFGHAVILAGGAASGKGFQSSRLLGIDGKIMDVDALKMLAVKSTKFAERIKQETGHDIKSFDFKSADNVSKLHDILSSVYGTTKKHEQTLYSSILAAAPDRKPNIIFDSTLKSLSKLESITRNIIELGYAKENIHIIWIVNDVNVAIDQNASRSRVVPSEILMDTHEGAALTMKKILDMGASLQKYMNGTIYLSFNKVGVDTSLAKSDRGGSYIEKADYVKVKEQGKPQLNSSQLDQRIVDKIKKYTPKTNTWD